MGASEEKINNSSMKGLSPSAIAWRRFRKNIPAVAGLCWIGLCAGISIFAYLIIPDNSSNGNFQLREKASSPPGTRVSYFLKPAGGSGEIPSGFTNFFFGSKDAGIPQCIRDENSFIIHRDSLIWIDIPGQVHTDWIPEIFLPINREAEFSKKAREESGKYYLLEEGKILYEGLEGGLKQANLDSINNSILKNRKKQTTFLLGSDSSGRDVFSRLVLGGRVSLAVGIMSVIISLLIGVTMGSIAGMFRGKIDRIIMWFVSVVWSIPSLLLAIAISYAMGGGFLQLFIAIGISTWVDIARLVRGQVFSLREMQYIEAGKALGFSTFRIIRRHIFPNIMGPVLIVAASNFATAILLEAGLSFLGVGVKPPVPSWGNMVYEGYSRILFDSGIWLAVFPSLALMLMVISVNLVAYGLRDALDPRHETSI